MTDPPATRLLRALRDTAGALSELNYPFALVGGLAVSIRCEPRFTRDVDLAVAVADDAAAEALVSNLAGRGFTLQLSLEHGTLDRLAAVRLVPPAESAEGIVVDLLFASSGIEKEICAAAEVMEVVAGLKLPVATAGHLLVMKLLARSNDRPQDDIDGQALLRVLSATERARTRCAAERIEQIGANRGKSLRADLEKLLGADEVVFPLTVRFEDGSTDRYEDERDLASNLEDFDSDADPDCEVRDALGRQVFLRLKLLSVKELRLR